MSELAGKEAMEEKNCNLIFSGSFFLDQVANPNRRDYYWVMGMHCSDKRWKKNVIYLKKILMKNETVFPPLLFAITNAIRKAISPPVAESPVWIGSSRFLLKITVTTCRDRTRHFHWLVSRALPKHVRSTLCRQSLHTYLRCPNLLTLYRLTGLKLEIHFLIKTFHSESEKTYHFG